MQCKILLASVFLFPTLAANNSSVSPKVLTENISLQFKKPAAAFWELGNKKDLATNTTSLKQSNWYSDAMKNIAASEYQFKWEEKLNAYCTPNRKNNLRFFYTKKGFSVEPRTTKIPIGDFDPMARPDEIKYKMLPNWKVKFNLDKNHVGKGTWAVTANKAEYITDKITVQYINNEDGMRQNFIVHAPLSKSNTLKLNLNIKTNLKNKLNGNQLQFFLKKTNVLNYEDLRVWDAAGKTLTASFKKSNKGKYCIQVNTKDAVYPITIDPINTTPAAMVESNQIGAQLGNSVASAGDVNGDGYSDVIVGAYFYDNGQNDEGAAFVYHGSATGINTTAAATVESNQINAQMGISVASAGDVNGDGYSDVIVGAYFYANGQADEGAAFMYHGSATGINTIAAATVESNQVGALMGCSVASAGDVNGDGYSDVIVGAYRYDNGQTDEGAAFVYDGSATGINTTAAAIVESNQINAQMGNSVASAGDVNGDGYSDVIVGARKYDNGQIDEGVAFVYHGSATGINTTAAATVESNQANAQMGISVASAGDVNGDGYSDVIVGAYGYANGQTDEGAAFVYHGSATGINTTAAATVESNQINAQMGISVASAGDVNGDGYSDVIVGAYFYANGQADEGAAFVYHGSATGINTIAAATVESNQVGALMGCSVASAGDVNGDGYSDVIVGARKYDNGQIDEGAAFVYYGNSPGTNKRNNLRLYNTNLTTPINSSNFIFGNFGAGLYAKSFLGRAKGKMVWETRLNYNAYSGTPITNSTFFTAQQASYSDLGLAGIELKNLIGKLLGSGRYTKLRARVKYDPVTAVTGQVYGPWRNVSAVIDGNSLGALPIELISFKAAWLQKGRSAKINFSTDKESGICCFDIEKSNDGFNFYTIGTLPAKNIAGIQSYSFIDNNANNKKQFYRLKIKGSNGPVDYSNIQQLQNNGAMEILIFPNPTTDVLQLQLNKVYDKMNVEIVNSAGQIVKQFNNLSTVNQTITIPVNNLPAGQYWLKLQGGVEKQVLQFVKQ